MDNTSQDLKDEAEDGVEGSSEEELELGGGTFRKGDDDLLRRLDDTMGGPNTGELLRSFGFFSKQSRTLVRTGEVLGNASSACFLGVRERLGEPELEGLAGRSCGEYNIRPEPLTPGMDCVRDIGEARAAADRDLEWPLDNGEAVRGLYGRAADEWPHDGDVGEVGLGSVLRRGVGGFLAMSSSSGGIPAELLLRRKDGTGEDLNASMRSVSGTGSMSAVGDERLHAGGDGGTDKGQGRQEVFCFRFWGEMRVVRGGGEEK